VDLTVQEIKAQTKEIKARTELINSQIAASQDRIAEIKDRIVKAQDRIATNTNTDLGGFLPIHWRKESPKTKTPD
jgi:chromosome segregation ATPase